jgi:hypothetical protein
MAPRYAGYKVLGGVMLAVLGWAVTQVVAQMQENENVIVANGNRISILEQKMEDHERMEHDRE